MRRSVYMKAVAYAMAWLIMALGVPGYTGDTHAVTTLNEQFAPRHVEITYAYNTIDVVYPKSGPSKSVLNIQQSDSLADMKIAEQVKAAVRRDPEVRTLDVVVFVSGGVVTMSGMVSTAQQKSRAEKLASEVRGVTAVINHIEVSKESSP